MYRTLSLVVVSIPFSRGFSPIGPIVCPTNTRPFAQLLTNTRPFAKKSLTTMSSAASDDTDGMLAAAKKWAITRYSDHTREGSMTGDAIFIRPSGNPLTLAAMTEMFNSGDITAEEDPQLIKVEKVGGNGKDFGYCVLTERQVFTYKGTTNDDTAVYTCILEKEGDEWKVCHVQRSQGRGPDDALPTGFN